MLPILMTMFGVAYGWYLVVDASINDPPLLSLPSHSLQSLGLKISLHRAVWLVQTGPTDTRTMCKPNTSSGNFRCSLVEVATEQQE